jgi:hypothetical protein
MGEPGEVESRDTRPPRSSGLTLVGLLGGAVLVAVLLGQLTAPDLPPRTPTTVATTNVSGLLEGQAPDQQVGVDPVTACEVQMGGLTLGVPPSVRGSAIEILDCGAPQDGPWSLVIRATGGHFGVRGAVVTYPAEDKGTGVPSTKPQGGLWNPGSRTLLFPLDGSHATIVGDLGQTTLENLAAGITIVNGRPHFGGLDGFTAGNTTSYQSPVVHEMRYGAVDLGQQATLGNGLVLTGVTWAASFESLAFESHAKPAGLVRHKPAVYSRALGGNGTLAWESAPGEVTYIGFSGNESSAGAIEALRALADKGKVLTPAQWETSSLAQVVPQPGPTP